MKRFLSLNLRTALVVTVILLTARLVWVASRAEIGWELLACQWQDATVGRYGLRPTSIDVMEPPEQADYWLAEIERILGDSPESAELVMGAACLLDSPDRTWEGHFGPKGKYTGTPPNFGRRPGVPNTNAANRQFERKCNERCLALAALATQLDPSDVGWWRLRAMLLFNPSTVRPRSDAWLDVLDECARHDPDNALYDYLAAMLLWNESGAVDLPSEEGWPSGQLVVAVEDEELFQKGLQRFEAGQEKKYVAVGNPAWSVVAQFLSLSRIRKIDQDSIVWHHAITPRIWIPQRGLFDIIWRCQVYRVKQAQQNGNAAQQARILRETFRFYEQATTREEMSAASIFSNYEDQRREIFEGLMQLAGEHPDLVSESEAARLAADERRRRIDWTIAIDARTALMRARLRAVLGVMMSRVVTPLPLLVLLLALIGLLALMLGRIVSREKSALPRFKLLTHLIAWAVAFGTTYVLLGIVPARMIRADVQNQIAIVVVNTIVLAIPALAAWRTFCYLRRRRFQFSLMWLFGVTLVCAVMVAVWVNVQSALDVFALEIPRRLRSMTGGWLGDDVNLAPFANGSWVDSVIQWLARGGIYVSGAVAMLILATWFASRYLRGSVSNTSIREIRQRWAMIMRDLARSGLVAAMWWLLIYLWFAAVVVQAAEDEYQYVMTHSRAPGAFLQQIDEARSRILASEEQMEEIRQMVEAELKDEGY